jgi:hypothetical protein
MYIYACQNILLTLLEGYFILNRKTSCKVKVDDPIPHPNNKILFLKYYVILRSVII